MPDLAPNSRSQDLEYWRGVADTRLTNIETSLAHMDVSIGEIRQELVSNRIWIAKVCAYFSVIVTLLGLLGPKIFDAIVKLLFTTPSGKP